MVSDEDVRRAAARLYYKSILSYFRLAVGVASGAAGSIACRFYGLAASVAVLAAVLSAGYAATYRLYRGVLPARSRALSGVIAMLAGVVAGIVIASQVPVP